MAVVQAAPNSNDEPVSAAGARGLDFVVAGAQKAGTTAVHAALATHPQLYLPPQKELHFFDDDRRDWRKPNYDRLLHNFGAAPPHRRCGDATPITMYWPRAMERLARLSPAVRVVVILRDPRDRALSHWRMEHGRGRETRPFGEAIRAGRRRVRAAPLGAHRTFSYVERGLYGRQLERALRLFGRERLCVLSFDELLDEPGTFYARLHDFLRVDRLGPPRNGPPGRDDLSDHRTLPMEDRRHLERCFERDLALLHAMGWPRIERALERWRASSCG